MPASTGWRRSRPRKARNDPDSDGIRQGGSGRSPSNVRGYFYFDGCSISQLLRRLVELRVSQINGCSYCIFCILGRSKSWARRGNAFRPSNIGELHYASTMPRELHWSGLNSSRELRMALPHLQL
jgi:hypothetical protein